MHSGRAGRNAVVGRWPRRSGAHRTDGIATVNHTNAVRHFERAVSEASRYLEGTLPNGMAFADNGDFLIANFGTDCLEIMSRDGPISRPRR
jgi:acyl-CoA thioesterase FadM